jgi:hypothetical protein
MKPAVEAREDRHAPGIGEAKTPNPVQQAGPAAATAAMAAPDALPAAPASTQILYRSTALGESYGRVSMAKLDAADEPRYVSPIECDRVHFAAGTGVCLAAKRGVFTTYHAYLFDRNFAVMHTVPLVGVPSRARVSPDGRLAAMTVFVSGHSYAGSDFSTRTSILDTSTGQFVIEDLETLSVTRDSAPFKPEDANFWGVTFTRDASRFYATLGTRKQQYLIEADIVGRQARIIATGVECPSLSPDGSRIAFKRRLAAPEDPNRIRWRLYVLELLTRAETELSGETRNIDDQVEWLNDQQVLYALPSQSNAATASTDTWVLAIRPGAVPRMALPFAFSPSVIR